MRHIGSLTDETQSRLLADYLLAREMPAHVTTEDDAWSVWVKDENHVEQAKQILSEFIADPRSPEYPMAIAEAEQKRAEQRLPEENTDNQTGKAPSAQTVVPLSQRAPLVMVLIGLSLFVGLVTDGGRIRNDSFHVLMTVDSRLFADPVDSLAQIKSGQLWRLVTPVFLHGSWLHVSFNMLWMFYLGSQIENRRGTVWFGALVLALAIASNATQLLATGPNFLGMSGVVYGLFGYIWINQLMRHESSPPLVLSEFSIFILMFFLVLGFADGLDSVLGADTTVANGAHVGGLVTGSVISYLDGRAQKQARRSNSIG